MLRINIVEYLRNPITRLLDIDQLWSLHDYYDQGEFEIYAFQFEFCYLEVCFEKGRYCYDMISFSPPQFERKRLLSFDFLGLDQNFTKLETEQFCKTHKLRHEWIRDKYGERLSVEARSIHFWDDNSISAIGGIREPARQ